VRKSGTYIDVNVSHTGAGLGLLIKNGDQIIGKLNISGELNINITRDATLLAHKLGTLDNTLIIHLQSNAYSSREVQVDA